ncbi:MAG: hypothetical protein WA594_07685, partial [Candidatus Sulfotelmatobacter sp.]
TGLILGALIALLAPRQEQAPQRAAIFLVTLLVLTGGATELAHHYGLPLRLGRAPFARTDNVPENNPAVPGQMNVDKKKQRV